jgi:hypothetical protein
MSADPSATLWTRPALVLLAGPDSVQAGAAISVVESLSGILGPS